MPHSTDPPPSVIEAEINYWLEPPEGQPRPTIYPGTAGSRRRQWDKRTVQVTDLRGREDEFKVDKNGFQVVPFPTEEKAYDDDERIKESVYPEAEELLKKTVGASKVHILGHIVRRVSTQVALDAIKDLPDDAEVKLQHPAMAAHVDQSYDGAQWILDSQVEEGTFEYTPNTRWAINNIWHPIKPINREPLAVCDARTVPDSDLQGINLRIKRPKNGVMTETDIQLWYPVDNPDHKWYWPKRLTPDEALLIKCFDSKQGGRARRAPHSAIVTPDDEGPARESIEMRCVVFWENEEEK